MDPWSLVAWWFGDALILCLLMRAWSQDLFRRYPFFYLYVGSVSASEAVRQYLYWRETERQFFVGWWVTEFMTAAVGFGVTWEIISQVLWPYPGVKRMARTVAAGLFSAVLIKASIDLAAAPLRALMPTTAELERNLRVIQALVLLAMLGLIVHYALPLGRNVRWMLRGHGFYVGSAVIMLTLLSEWRESFVRTWTVLPGLQYCATLVLWCVGMWSFAPNPTPDLGTNSDYNRLTGQTLQALGRLRNHLVQPWRSE